MPDYRRSAAREGDYGDIPDRETEEVRDEVEREGDFDDDEEEDEEDEEEDDADLGKSVLDQERGAAAIRGYTDEIGSEGGSSGNTRIERRRVRRASAGEATTPGGHPADEVRFERAREEE